MERSNNDSSGASFSRRSLLKSGVGLAVGSGTAGCAGFDPSEIRRYEFTAAPVGLREPLDRMTYESTANFEQTIERHPTLAGVEVTVSVTSYVSVYESSEDTLALVASPLAEIPVVEEPQNPLAKRSMRELLRSDLGERLLRNANVIEGEDLRWARGPEQVAKREVTFLDRETTIRSFAGIVEGEGFFLLTAARVHDANDVVLATIVQHRGGSAPSLVGDNGFVTRSAVVESVDRLSALLEFVDRTGVGLRIPESNLITTDSTDENYVRVVVENEHDGKVLYSVGLMIQLFDDQGSFLDMQVGGIDRLGPGESFTEYIPHYVEGVAAHAIESHYTTRDVGAETPENVQIIDDILEEGRVSGEVRNTGSETTPGFTLRVTFYADDESVLGSASRQFPGLPEGASEKFEADIAETEAMPNAEAADYAVEVVRYDREPLYVR